MINLENREYNGGTHNLIRMTGWCWEESWSATKMRKLSCKHQMFATSRHILCGSCHEHQIFATSRHILCGSCRASIKCLPHHDTYYAEAAVQASNVCHIRTHTMRKLPCKHQIFATSRHILCGSCHGKHRMHTTSLHRLNKLWKFI